MSISHTDMILNLARSNGLLRMRDVDSAGAPRALLASLKHKGQLVRLGRGLDGLPDRPPSKHDSLAEVSAKSSTGVVCLIRRTGRRSQHADSGRDQENPR